MINIQNIDDKWSVVKFKSNLNYADRNPEGITKADKEFAKRLEYKDMKYSVKIRDIQKFEKQIPSTLVFLVMKIKKTIKSICQKML